MHNTYFGLWTLRKNIRWKENRTKALLLLFSAILLERIIGKELNAPAHCLLTKQIWAIYLVKSLQWLFLWWNRMRTHSICLMYQIECMSNKYLPSFQSSTHSTDKEYHKCECMLVCYQSWLPSVIGIGIGIYSNSHANIYISIWQPYQKYHHGIFISPKIHIDFLHKCPNWDIFEIFTVCRANKKPWNNIGRKMLKMTKHDKSDFHKW